MASSLAIYYTPMHFMWGVKSGATPVIKKNGRLMIIHDASHKHIQPLTSAYFRRDLIKIW